jgi:hypothetical protein
MTAYQMYQGLKLEERKRWREYVSARAAEEEALVRMRTWGRADYVSAYHAAVAARETKDAAWQESLRAVEKQLRLMAGIETRPVSGPVVS